MTAKPSKKASATDAMVIVEIMVISCPERRCAALILIKPATIPADAVAVC